MSSIFFMVLFPMLFKFAESYACVKIKQTLNNELKFYIVIIITVRCDNVIVFPD